ncbi:3'-5' exonuclease [Metabacillus fastidiosus]|uniref:3'-5' exonuclease n=1 Tax=Metabacillus fastidiosus TaxID=1458 RepID=UPI002DBC7E0D|nr:3'-5' exonuclease [Metabacillus fastidiosus]MEC2075948.1 exonuclease domain-containing protein [Metabacillus fastidiosus]
MADIRQFIFFDFEMLCSDTGMAFENMEAIRLGAVKYNLETEQITYFDRYINPEFKGILPDFCKKLTGIEDGDLAEADSFKNVFEEFLTWIGGIKKTRYFSWSQSDLFRLKLDADRHDIAVRTINKFEKRYIDFQAIFKKRVSKEQVSVEDALALYGLSFTGEKHNPMYDAYNTLKIYLHFLNDPIQSDLIMLKQFFFEGDASFQVDQINEHLSRQIKRDAQLLTEPLREVHRLKEIKKWLKPIRKLVEKYENILFNRSRLISEENILHARYLINFYHELLLSYNEHSSHFSKIYIFNEYMVQPLKKITVK